MNTLGKQVGGSHYDFPIQPIEYIVKNDIPYREANVIKYVSRHRRKNGKQDILKAIHYLEMILEEYDEEASKEVVRTKECTDCEDSLEWGPIWR